MTKKSPNGQKEVADEDAAKAWVAPGKKLVKFRPEIIGSFGISWLEFKNKCSQENEDSDAVRTTFKNATLRGSPGISWEYFKKIALLLHKQVGFGDLTFRRLASDDSHVPQAFRKRRVCDPDGPDLPNEQQPVILESTGEHTAVIGDAPPIKWQGDLQITICSDATGYGWAGLDYPGILPLQANDGYNLAISLNKVGFAYVFLIRPDGVVKPIYPYLVPGDWTSRPAIERPLEGENPFLFEPRTGQNPWWRIPAGPPGMLTFVLLAGPKPLAAAENLQTLIGPIEPQTEGFHRSTVWFENGLPARNRLDRDHDFEQVEFGDPISAVQRRIREYLIGNGNPFCYSLSVSFATNGRKAT